jgi:folate-binding protein YgfZ
MLLEAADQALQEAGYDKRPFDRTRVGVIVGTEFGGDFALQLQMGLRLPHMGRILKTLLTNRGLSTEQAEKIEQAFGNALLQHWPALIDESGSFSTSSLASRITKTWDLGGGAAALDGVDYESLRVEAGLPAAGHELTETYTPLETGLEAAISDNKGCYTGQEIIARQITYDKVTQHLCGLRLSQPASPGARIWAEEKLAGQVTSITASPRYGPLALAIIKRPYFEPGTAVLVGETIESAIQAQVQALPFQI